MPEEKTESLRRLGCVPTECVDALVAGFQSSGFTVDGTTVSVSSPDAGYPMTSVWLVGGETPVPVGFFNRDQGYLALVNTHMDELSRYHSALAAAYESIVPEDQRDDRYVPDWPCG